MKPGVMTSEFWVSVLTGVYLVLNTTGVLTQIPEKYSSIALAIVTALYTLSRGVAKHSGQPEAQGFLGMKGDKV